MTSVFLSYARGDDEPFVRRLYEDLTRAGFDVWFDRVSMPARQLTFHHEIQNAVANRDRLLLVAGPNAATSEYVQQEWRFALEVGKCVNPTVRLDGKNADGYSLLPEELKLIHAEDFRDDAQYPEHLANLVRQLSEDLPPLGKLVAVPTLPAHYRAQPERLKKLREALLIDLQRPVVITGAAARVGVQGMGGIGKSVLAQGLARDLEVRRAFPDGVLWIPIGQQPNIVERLRETAKALGDDALFNDIPTGKQKLRELLAERRALLILDDVWQRPDADAFDVLGPKCKLLLTTRDAGLVTALTGTDYQVQLPSEAEALALLATAAQTSIESLPSEARLVVAECGRLPLALALCGGMVQAGTPWADTLAALREHDLEFIGAEHTGEEQHRNIWRAMEVSIRVLPEDQQQRFAELAVFPEDTRIPEAAVLTLWAHTAGLSQRHARQTLVQLKQRSVIQLDRRPEATTGVGDLTMHDLLHDVAVRLAERRFGSLKALHEKMVEAYRAKCPDGWPSGPNDGYFFTHLREHLIAADRASELAELLHELRWLEVKNEAGLAFDLVQDFSTALQVLPTDQRPGKILGLLDEALRRDIHFIARHARDYPQGLFQCLWNSCWWYDAPEAAAHYDLSKRTGKGARPWKLPAQDRLAPLLKRWRAEKELSTPGFLWLESLRPQITPVGNGLITILQGHTHQVTSVSASPVGDRLATGSRDGSVRIWDVNVGQELAARHWGSDIPVLCVSYSPDGTQVASGCGDRMIRIWDTGTDEETILKGQTAFVDAVCYSPDGLCIAGVSLYDKAIRVWDVRRRAQVAAFGRKYPALAICFSPDGSLVATGHTDGIICLWNVTNWCQTKTLKAHKHWVRGLCFSPDSRFIASASWDRTACLSNVRTGRRVHQFVGHKHEVMSATYSHDGRFVATGSCDGSIRVWNARSGREWVTLREHSRPVLGVCFLPAGNAPASASADETARMWYIPPKDRLPELRNHAQPVACIAFSTNQQILATASVDGQVKIWDAKTGQERGVFDSVGGASCIACSPEGDRIAVGTENGRIIVGDTVSFNWLGVLRPNMGMVGDIGFSPDGQRIVGMLLDLGRVWDATSGEYLKQLHSAGEALSMLGKKTPPRFVARTHGICDESLIVVASGASPKAQRGPQFVPGSETVVLDVKTGLLLAWFPTPFQMLAASPAGRTWAGVADTHLMLFTLEGKAPSAS